MIKCSSSLLWLTPLLLLVVGVLRQHSHYNQYVRREVLHSTQPLLYPPSDLHVATVLGGSKVDGEFSLSLKAARLRQGVEEARGRVVYLGRAAISVVRSEQISEAAQDGPELYLVTQWSSPSDRDIYLTQLRKAWQISLSQGFKRNPFFNLALPQGLGALSLKDSLLGIQYDTQTPFQGNQEMPQYWSASEFKRFTKLIVEGGAPEEGVYIWNWVLEGTPEQVQQDRAYGLKMMQMLAQNGGGVMDVGSAHALPSEEESFHFDQVVGVYYPGRRFFAELISSQWMMKTVRGKNPGDSLAVITFPLPLVTKE